MQDDPVEDLGEAEFVPLHQATHLIPCFVDLLREVDPKPKTIPKETRGISGRTVRERRRDQSSVRKRSRFRVVEAAGVEPASENVTGQETTCLFAFMPWALPQDVRCCCSERTRNTSR